MAERRHVNAEGPQGVQNGAAGGQFTRLTIDNDTKHSAVHSPAGLHGQARASYY